MKTNRHLFLLFFFTLTSAINAQIIHVNEDFNTGSLPTGWTNSALSGTDRWQFGVDGSNLDLGNNNIDSSNFAYFDDDALGATSLNNTVQLSTLSFNNISNSLTFLSFEFNLKVFSTINDSFYVEVFDGANWNTVFSIDDDSCGSYTSLSCAFNGYPKMLIDISSFSNSNCIVRFIYHDGNDFGFHIGLDNILIYSPEANDIGVSSIIYPTDGLCSLTDSETISCIITNYSADTITNFQITASIDSGSQLIVDTVNTTLLPFDSLFYSFIKKVDLSLLKSYDIQLSTSSTLDLNKKNDSTYLKIPSRSLKSLPYFDGFESATNDWTISGTNPSWERGFPKKNAISRPASGSNAFVTKLDSNSTYNSDELSFLTSPCISIDSSINKLLISFYLIFNTEQVNDEFWIEYTIDGGLNWNKLQKSTPKLRWYNVDSKDVWGGSTRDWVNYRMTFEKPINTSEIKFRFVFKSDRFVEREGVGIDDFLVRPVNTTDLIISEVISPRYSPNNLCGLSSDQEVEVELLNIGSSSVDSVKISYQNDAKFPFTEQFSDTILGDSSYTYTFLNRGDFSAPKKITLSLFLEYKSGVNFTYDTLIRSIDNNYFSYKRAPYFENFDSIFKPIGGTLQNPTPDTFNTDWSRSVNIGSVSNSRYLWRVSNDYALTSLTGPINDHTGNGGNYLLANIQSGSLNNETFLLSPCISIQSSNAELSFWYHRFGSYFNNLYIDIYKNGQWNEAIDSLSGSSQSSSNAPYLQKKIPLSNYSNEFIIVRFRPIFDFSEDAIDDFHVYDTSIVTGLPSNVQGRKQLLLFPNPNNGEFTLATSKQLIGSRYVVFNISGQLVVNGILSNQKTKINLADFGKGVYFIRIPEKNLSEKLIVY